MGMSSSPGTLPSFICFIAILTSASGKGVGVNVGVGSDQLGGWMFSHYLKRAVV